MNDRWNEYMRGRAASVGSPPGYVIETMGCQMNERDSETIAALLEGMGYARAPSRREADVIVVNTCGVRDNAEKRFFGILGQIKKSKEQNPSLVTAVCGCMMQQGHIVDEVRGRYPWVDIVFGTHNIDALPGLLEGAVLERAAAVDVRGAGGEIREGLPSVRGHKFKAFVNIMFGCDNYCTYCIVPYTRGRERSRSPEAVLAEVRALAADGVKEVMLLGQNVNSYAGRGPDGAVNADFPELLRMVDDIPGLERVRFMTSHPKDMSDRLAEAFRERRKLCNVIHLPVQSGSTRILRRMNRSYTKEEYLALIGKVRRASPDIAITTDIITGFPGETEEDFEETMDLVERVRFDSAFTFLYSVRKGTPAASFDGHVPDGVKHERFNRLVERMNAITAEKNAAYVGRVEAVLAEGAGKKGRGVMAGRTDTGKLVNFKAPADVAGTMVSVRITAAKTFSLAGELAEE
jgi:tRNA-2-methylthio-N6-dimethylallyladenosine synthase